MDVQSECLICVNKFDSERLYCYGQCGHSDICSICFLRMRALQRNFNCPTCKANLDQVICSEKAGLDYSQFSFWGESCGNEHEYDQRSQMHFPKAYFRSRIEPMWTCKCRICNTSRKDMKSLRGHIQGEHNLHMCLLCIENRQLFPSEFCCYTQSEYEKHLRNGDNNGCEGHPYCEFCRKRYFDKTAIFMHLIKDHFSCHICSKLGIQYRYYADYSNLEAHFRSEHFMCEEPSCIEKRFVVFANTIDLSGHMFQWHPGVQYSRVIPTNFRYGGSIDNKTKVLDRERERGNSSKSSSSSSSDAPSFSRKTEDGRYDGGLGGVASNGEWQVELSFVPTDPRDPSRSTSSGPIPLQPVALSDDVEDFPALPESRPMNSLSNINWLKPSKDKDERFPGLPSKKSSGKDARAQSGKASSSKAPAAAVAIDGVSWYSKVPATAAVPLSVPPRSKKETSTKKELSNAQSDNNSAGISKISFSDLQAIGKMERDKKLSGKSAKLIAEAYVPPTTVITDNTAPTVCASEEIVLDDFPTLPSSGNSSKSNIYKSPPSQEKILSEARPSQPPSVPVSRIGSEKAVTSVVAEVPVDDFPTLPPGTTSRSKGNKSPKTQLTSDKSLVEPRPPQPPSTVMSHTGLEKAAGSGKMLKASESWVPKLGGNSSNPSSIVDLPIPPQFDSEFPTLEAASVAAKSPVPCGNDTEPAPASSSSKTKKMVVVGASNVKIITKGPKGSGKSKLSSDLRQIMSLVK